MLIAHALFSDGALHVWGEESGRLSGDGSGAGSGGGHPFAAPVGVLREVLGEAGAGAGESALTLHLPTASGGVVLASKQMRRWGDGGPAVDEDAVVVLGSWRVPTVTVVASDAQRVLDRLEELSEGSHERALEEGTALGEGDGDGDVDGGAAVGSVSVGVGDSVRFFSSASRLARSLLAEQRFVPMVIQDESGGLRAAWRPWLSDEGTAARVGELLGSMPASARAQADEHDHDGWSVLTAFMGAVIDGSCRRVLEAEEMVGALRARRVAVGDPHVGWLEGLLDETPEVPSDASVSARMMRTVRHWIGGLEARGISSAWRLCLVLNEPLVFDEPEGGGFGAPPADARWALTFRLRSVEKPSVEVEAEDVWVVRSESVTLEGLRLDDPKEVLLSELARASKLFDPLEETLGESEPTVCELTTKEAYEFLREHAPLLEEQGFSVETPEWWDTPAARIGGRLKIDSPELDPSGLSSTAPGAVGASRLGLNALVSYEWSLAVGDTPVSLHEFEKLASEGSPLVRINGQWVEIRPEDVEQAVEFLHANPGGEMRIGDAMRMAFNSGISGAGLPILGIDATGWAAAVLGDMEETSMPMLGEPAGFEGELRPYQRKGMSWLAFLDRVGLGPCLADDMGLGKTIQMLALLQHEKNDHESALAEGLEVEDRGPTLLVVPMSIVGNWMREARKFTPGLRVLVHHGAEREGGDEFVKAATVSDLVVTTYALAHRDREVIGKVPWHRVVLDEAQNIKNPSAKQSLAVRELEAPRRIALTGTPLENRLSELWSVMDFCNPGFLGTSGEFRRAFAVPVERYRDSQRATQLRQLVRPFILRRLKTDPLVISDLPDKFESKEYCRLTGEQATLYENTVKEMLSEVERSEGIRRRGIVLTTLIRLKQICDHPALLSKDGEGDDGGRANPARSGKCIRLIEMLEEVISSEEQALIFTQFRQMGHLLGTMLRHAFDRDVMFLHGGVPQGQREKLVERFQKADGSAPIFILSLKAGGVGLNLTAASHVFHFDRWWNPAVENQATDRAFRIGQDKTVNVHKFIIGGTLEERIDQMIESKVALAEDIIGSGEDWLTELSTTQLQDVLRLRPDALEVG